MHYLKHGFYFDLLAAAPLDLLVWLVGSNTFVVTFFRLPRLLRLHDYVKFIAAQRNNLYANQLRVELQWLFSLMAAIFHVTAVLWWYITQQQGNRSNIERIHVLQSPSQHTFCSIPEECSIPEQYLFAMWYVSAEILMTGHGDFLPSTMKERHFAVLLMMLNLSLFAYITSAMSNFILSADEKLVEMRADMSAVEQYIGSNAFSPEVQAEMRSTFDFILGAKAGGLSDTEDGMVYGMLSHVLQVDVSQHTSRAALDNVNAFKGTSSSFLESLAVLLVEKTLPPSTFLFRENDPSKALYFVARGVVEALAVNADTLATDPKIDRVYTDDCVLGEVPFFFSIRQLFSARTRVNQLVRIYELSVRSVLLLSRSDRPQYFDD